MSLRRTALTPLIALALTPACGGSSNADGSSSATDNPGTDSATDGVDESGTDATDPTDDGPLPENCGNGMLDEGETCDGSDFGGQTCADFGGESGELSCNACQINTDECVILPATQFGEGSTWSLPEGGDSLEGFYALGGNEWDKGDQSWAVADMTGDGRPDLVILHENGEPIESGGEQFWWVHPNTGDGFGDPMAWELPEGGDSLYGFYAMAGNEWDKGDQSWAVTDMTGDGRPDLVILHENGEPIMSGGDQFWWVHENTGSGFGDATTWALPAGGDSLYGFYALGGNEWDIGDQSWAVTDMTGDGQLDLVILHEDGEPIMSGSDQFWWVHPNTGDGFGEVTTWSLPEGGDSLYGFYAMAGNEWDEGDQSWSVTDIDGDGQLDLVILHENGEPIMSGSDQFWWVHPGTGSGFGDATTWALPQGGDSLSGFYALAGNEWDKGDQAWSVTDMTGNGQLDLVILHEDGEPIMSGSDQYWWVHPNTGDGFGEPTTWALPPGGDSVSGYYNLFGNEWDEGDQSWATLDMTGDRRPDLVILNEDGDPLAGPSWRIHRGEP